ncbi:hypothetical protein GIB67_034465 [Kingdonia uniflora]|uniref:KIB1-4 beta-propeller domain-containing protein n=1 Tax=Kingdonia uniflora TaxID=39325 RepID=A0A7J7PB71_9MAGN|nr:hypothetical protein GIB67_034465 [Kingdonia uniflora]
MVFFFCPFSRAKINLPQFPCNPQQYGHVGVFTSAPTSPNCTVGIISHIDKASVELNLLRQGHNEWVTHVHSPHINTITCATFHEGKFYFLDSLDRGITFAVQNESWVCLHTLKAENCDKSIAFLPFKENFNHFKTYIGEKLGLEDGGSVSTCGTTLQLNQLRECIHNEDFKARGEKETCQMKGVYIQPRFFQIPPNQSWSI